ncbi:tail length tape measure protein [Vibrio phage 1254]
MSEVAKKYVLTYEADVKSYVDGVEKMSVTTRRMAVNSKQDAASVEKAVSQAGLKNVRVYEESATTLARTVKAQLASNKKLVNSHKTSSSQIIAANDATYSAIQRNNRGNRAVMQSAGYQLQDVMVQAQQNTNAWMILSQQGSQFASSFGAGGAVAGALISIVGLVGMLTTANKEATDSFDKLVNDGVNELTEAEKRLAKQTADARGTEAFLDVEEYKAKLEALNIELKNTQKESRGFLDSITGRSEGEVAKEIDQVTVALEKATGEMDKFRSLSRSTESTPFVDPGQSKVYTAEYKTRVATLNELTKSMEKQTRTFDEEYAYRKGIIDSFLHTEEEAARHYGALEKWKTAELQKEADKRAKITQANIDSNMQAAITAENKRKRALGTSVNQVESLVPAPDFDDYEAELARHKAFQETFAQAYAATSEWDLTERTRLNNAKEVEEARHAATMNEIVTEAYKSQREAQMEGAEQLAGTMASAAQEGSAAYKILFATQQAFAIANGTMQSFSAAQTAYTTAYQAAAMANAGSPVAHVVSLAEAEGAYATTLSLGLANVGATAGVAFAGAFDKGGDIPNNSMGIVSEYGDELVGGTLVYNQSGSPLSVTGREKTAEMMKSGGGSSQTQTTIKQNFYINGNPDKTALAEMKRMANNGRDEAYAMVARDFKTDRGISKSSARRR